MIINDGTVFTIDSNGNKWWQGVQKFWTDTIGKYDRSNYSYELYNCIGESYVYVMTSQSDTNMCAHINTLKSVAGREAWSVEYITVIFVLLEITGYGIKPLFLPVHVTSVCIYFYIYSCIFRS